MDAYERIANGPIRYCCSTNLNNFRDAAVKQCFGHFPGVEALLCVSRSVKSDAPPRKTLRARGWQRQALRTLMEDPPTGQGQGTEVKGQESRGAPSTGELETEKPKTGKLEIRL